MPARKRYIVAHRSGPRIDPQSSRDMETFVKSAADAEVVRKTSVGRTVLALREEQARDLARNHPHLVVEEDADLQLFGMPGLPPRVPVGEGRTLAVEVRDPAGKGIPGVSVYAMGQSVAYRGLTDAHGRATVQILEGEVGSVVASPRDTYWSRVMPAPVSLDAPVQVELKPLLLTGSYDWGHRLMGFRQVNRWWRGAGVRVAVVDSGLQPERPEVQASGGYDALDDEEGDDWTKDVEGHGTHVAGIIAGVDEQQGLLGGAPEVELYAVKVFPGGRLSDLVEGIEWCIRNRMDVVNLSLGSAEYSQVLDQVLRDAYDRGITLIAAAGNDGGPVAYPAALPSVLGIGALGRFGTFPEDSAHLLKVGRHRDWHGGLFSAAFSNVGSEVDVCAPGVAVLSTVPSGLAAWDGTSMACPLVTALAALVLEGYPELRTGDASQCEGVMNVIRASAADLGMPPDVQGYGLPLATRALASARPPTAPPTSRRRSRVQGPGEA